MGAGFHQRRAGYYRGAGDRSGPDGRIIRFNRACESVTGYALEDVQGKNFLDLLIIPEERERVGLVFEELCNGKYPNDGESLWLTKKGDRRLITWKNAVLLDEAFSVEYVIATGLDITEHRQAERTLYQSEERFRALFENAPVGIAISCNSRIVLANRAFHYMFDLKSDAKLRKSGIDYIAPDCRQEIIDRMSRREQGQAVPELLETVGLKDDGTSFPIFIESARLDLPDVPAIVAFISDITDRKLAEEKLRESYARLEKTLEQAVKSLSAIAEIGPLYRRPSGQSRQPGI